MDLFPINRFLGDNKTEEIPSFQEISRRLAQLVSKVEERKKRVQQSSEVETPQDAHEASSQDVSSVDIASVPPDAGEGTEQDGSTTTSAVRKTKRKKSVVSDSIDIAAFHPEASELIEQDGDTSTSDVKKVKRKKSVVSDSIDIAAVPSNDREATEQGGDRTTLVFKKPKRKKRVVSDSVDIVSITPEADEVAEQGGDTAPDVKKTKRKKRLMSESIDIAPVPPEAIEATEQDGDTMTSVKRKKKDVLDSDGDADEQLQDDTSSSNVVPHKQKKKRKKKSVKLNNDGTESEPLEGFMVLGQDHFKKKSKVKRVLPYWLANPTVISVNLQELHTCVEDIRGLDDSLVERLKENKVTHFFPVQSVVIPYLLRAYRVPGPYRPCDICVSSPTGSGKTLTFVLPIIQNLKSRVIPVVKALVVLPVQDLAVQVYKVFVKYCKRTQLQVALITGQNSFEKEQKQLIADRCLSGTYSRVDIIVTTPGRLVDHIKLTPNFSLKYLKFLVIDEADRVLDNVQNDWLYHVEKHIGSGNSSILSVKTIWKINPPPPQKLLFSATLSQDPEKLQQLNLFMPKLFTSVIQEETEGAVDSIHQPGEEVRGDFVGKYTTPAELEEMTCLVSMSTKPLVLYRLIVKNKWHHMLCFTNSQKAAHRLALLLNHLGHGKFTVAEISSALKRTVRDKILDKFMHGDIDVIVCTDSLARGMDILGVDYVISYEPPRYVKTYIHRIGRTARAGRRGMAVTFILENQIGPFRHILQVAGKTSVGEIRVPESKLQRYEDKYRDALEALKRDLQKEESEAKRRVKKIRKSSFKELKSRPMLKGDLGNPDKDNK